MKEIVFVNIAGLASMHTRASDGPIDTPAASILLPTVTAPLLPTDMKAAEALISAEVELIYEEGEGAAAHDVGHLNAWGSSRYFAEKRNYSFSPPDLQLYTNGLRRQLLGIRWRFRSQEPFYLAIGALVNKGLLISSKLRASPIRLTKLDEDVVFVDEILKHFPVCKRSFDSKAALQGPFPAPVWWFAKLITHACTDFQGIISHLCTLGFFGDFDDQYRSIASQNVRGKDFFYVGENSDIEHASMQGEESLPAFGFWLPTDFTRPKAFARDWSQRYNHAQRVFEQCFGAGSWGDSTLIRESLEPWLEEEGQKGTAKSP